MTVQFRWKSSGATWTCKAAADDLSDFQDLLLFLGFRGEQMKTIY